MEGLSMVSRARIAFNSAATKAERVFSDFKSDLRELEEQSRKGAIHGVSTSESELKSSIGSKQLWWKSPRIGTKQEWHDRLKNLGKDRKETEDVANVERPRMSLPTHDPNIYLYDEKVSLEAQGLETTFPMDSSDVTNKDIIPPPSLLKQLAIAIESEKNCRFVRELLTSSATSSPVREKASLGISAVKSIMLRGKEEKVISDLGDDEVWSFIKSILDAEGLSLNGKVGFFIDTLPGAIALPREIHGSPPESLIVKVSEVIGNVKTLQKMALFWRRLVAELRRLWLDEQYVPGIPHDEVPDLCCCLLYQQMQLINCCISRKRRHAIATDSLDNLIREAECDANGVPFSSEKVASGSFLCARTPSGELLVRLGASHQADNLTMLETGEPIYAPVTQEGPLVTEDLAREAEEFVMRTGSVGAGCSQLLSDMQAFKAANPGCILEDFVRWHSPPDWTETESGNDSDTCYGGDDSTSSRGRLSARMHKEGNLWRELWETAKPIPAVRQAPLFDEELTVEGVLTLLEEISPSQLFGQLYRSLIALGFVIAEAKLASDESFAKLYNECRDYVVASFQTETWMEKIDDLCQVYETVEAMYVRPEAVRKLMKQPEDTNVTEEPKHRFKKLTQIFGRENRLKKSLSDKQGPLEDNQMRQPFSNFFESKPSLFSKKPPKPESSPPLAKNTYSLDENEWTVVN